MTQPSLLKVLRCAVLLRSYNYTFIHNKGVDNVLADHLGFWSAPVLIRRFSYSYSPIVYSKRFGLELSETIVCKESRFSNSRPSNFQLIEGLWKNASQLVSILEYA